MKRSLALAPMRASAVARKYGFRSGLEKKIADELNRLGVSFSFESEHLHYIIPASDHTYTPDFRIQTKSGKIILIETKGRFLPDDRRKHLLIKEQHPAMDVRFVFSNANAKLDKRYKTTCGAWATKNGFMWADKTIPEAWLSE